MADFDGRNSTSVTNQTDGALFANQACRYFGASVRAGGLATTVTILDGLGEIIDIFTVSANSSKFHWFGPEGIACVAGIGYDVDANTAALVLYH